MIVHNAESLVQRFVAYETKGKFQVTVGKISFHPFQRRIDLIDISLSSVNAGADAVGFAFAGDKVSLQLSHIRPLIFRQQLLVDSILFESPRIKVIQQPVRKGWGTNSTRKMTLHEALGDVYIRLQNLFKVLYVKRGEINNGELILADNTDSLHPTLSLKGIYFLLERLNVNRGRNNEKDEFMFSQNIIFHTGPESIDLPDGLHHLSFTQLTLNTAKRFVEIDDCHIQGVSKTNSQNRVDIFNKKLKLLNLDFAALYSENIIRVDSLYCLDPNLTLELGHANVESQSGKKKYNYDSLQQIVKMVAGNLAVHYLGIVNADITTFINIKNKVNTFSTEHASFQIYDLNVNTESGMPATVRRVDFALRNYKGYTPDSMYIIKFDSIRLLSDKLMIWNAGLSPGRKAANSFKDIHIKKFELTDVDWLDYLKNKRLTARRAILDDATVKIFVERQNKARINGSVIDFIHSINPSINVENLAITNATITYEVKNKFSLDFESANVEVSVRDLITSDSLEFLHRSLKYLSAIKGTFKSRKLNAMLSNIHYVRTDSTLNVDKIQILNENGLVINANDFFVKGFNKSPDMISVKDVGWKNATVNMKPPNSNGNSSVNSKNELRFKAASINFSNTMFSFVKNDQKINAQINYVRGKAVETGKATTVNELSISGNQISLETNNLHFQSGPFLIGHNVASWIRSLNFAQTNNGIQLSVLLPELRFTPDVNAIADKEYVVNDVALESPTVKYTHGSNNTDQKAKKEVKDLPHININVLQIINPELLVNQTGSNAVTIDMHGDEVKFENVRTNLKKLDARNISAKINSLKYKNASGLSIESGKEKIEAVVDAAHFTVEKDTTVSGWQALVKKIVVGDIQCRKIRNDSVKFVANIRSMGLTDFLAKEKSMKSFERIVRDNSNAGITNTTVSINTERTNLYCGNLQYKDRNLALDSLSVLPVLSWEEFNDESAFQRDYIRVRSGKLYARGIDLQRYASEKKLVIKNLEIHRPIIHDSKDKRLVFKTGIIKPLPAQILTKVDFPMLIDTVNVVDGFVSYTETSDKTNKTGVISFNHLNAWIHPLKNFDFQPTDSLRLRADAVMLDSMPLTLRIRESYTDTLAGFWMTVTMKPTEIPILNPVLEPLASVQINSGKLEHLEMRAIGREYVSFGEMRFYYRDLKVKILKDGELQKRTFLTNLATFVANKFVIRTNNTDRLGRVFFIRNRERSMFNYWLKMALSGVASSAGAKNNTKMIKQYKDVIKDKQLPPIDFE